MLRSISKSRRMTWLRKKSKLRLMKKSKLRLRRKSFSRKNHHKMRKIKLTKWRSNHSKSRRASTKRIASTRRRASTRMKASMRKKKYAPALH